MIEKSIQTHSKKNFRRLTVRPFGFVEGNATYQFLLSNKTGMQVNILNYGAIIQSILTPDKCGNMGNVVLGYDNLDAYLNDPYYIGGIVGRYAGRIDNGRFSLNNQMYNVSVKPGGFHHHGGEKGFNKMIWDASPFETETTAGVTLFYMSKDGEEGFPGNLSVWATYTLSDDNSLQVSYKASTDKTTVHNLTQHSYFNLTGLANETILAHQLQLHSKTVLPVNGKIIPTGEHADVSDTVFDFSSFHSIGERINRSHPQLDYADGYDHTYVLKNLNSSTLLEAATVNEPNSGRQLEVFTTEPTLHFYSGNYLGQDEYENTKPSGFLRRSAFCLETQHAGDCPNRPEFPTVVLNPGEMFSSITVFKFSVMQNDVLQKREKALS